MTFERPEILFFLLLLIIPILLHLFNLNKYKKVYFSNIQLLQKIKTEKKHLSNLKKLILLLSRLILLSALIFAFAKPFIKSKSHSENTFEKISIYIDNSLSMSHKNKISLLEEAKNIAKQIINKYNDEIKINILSNNFEFKNEKFFNKEKSLKIIEDIQLSPFSIDLCEIIKRQNRISNHDSLVSSYLISDFKKDVSIKRNECDNLFSDKNLIKLNHSNKNNISLNSCYLKTPFRKYNKEEELIIEIENHGSDKKKNILLQLFINEKKRGFLNIDIEGNTKIKKSIKFKNLDKGNIIGKIVIDNDDFKYDNTLFFSYEVKDQINILTISENKLNNSIKKVFNDPMFILENFNEKQINFEKIQDYDLIVFDHLTTIQKGLSSFIKKNLMSGKNIIVFPNKNIDINSYNYFFNEISVDKINQWKNKKNEINNINYDHLIFQDVFNEKNEKIKFPYSKGFYELKTNKLKQRKNILKFFNNEPFFIEYKNFKGSFYLCTSPLDIDISNFTKHALFLPIMFNASLSSGTSNLYETISQNLNIKCNDCSSKSNLLKKDNDFEFTLSNKLINKTNYLEIGKKVTVDGTYDLFSNEENKKISFNYNREESELNNTITNPHITKWENTNDTIEKIEKKTENRKNLISYFIILAIISFLFETLILKFWKN